MKHSSSPHTVEETGGPCRTRTCDPPDYESVKLEKIQVNVNDRVRIIGGPLMEREGNIVEIKHKTVKVQLPSLGYTLTAIIEKSNVEILSLYGEISSSNVI